MYDGVRRLSVLMIVLCVALLVTYWLRGSKGEYGLFELLRGDFVSLPAPSNASLDTGQPGGPFTPGRVPPIDLEDVSVLAHLSQQKSALAAAVVPSVVSIETEKTVRVPRVIQSPLFGGELIVPEPGVEPGQGSGVIISEEGHVVTNHHVIEGAGAITVMIADRRQFRAKVMGVDPVADIAVLKLDVEPDMRFPPLPLGDSDRVRQGEMVFSVGSPFGLDGTFTDGVISSAVPRRVSDSTPPLLQTNTILNQGNSGGPLVNVRGEVIGINSAIYSGADRVADAGSAYGLAIPSNAVRTAVERIILQQGEPSYGYLGVYLKDVYPHEAIALGLQSTEGCLVNGTLAGSPAHRAGLRRDDVIIRYDGAAFAGIKELVHLIQTTEIGRTVALSVVRERKEITVSAVIRGNGSVEIPEASEALVSASWERTGLRVDYVAASERRRRGYEPSRPMVEITEIRPSSIAERMGLHPGLLIHGVDHVPTQTPKEFYEILQERAEQTEIKLTISSPGRRGSVDLRMPLG